MNTRKLYKSKTFGFGNLEEGRYLRTERIEEARKKCRSQTFSKNRNVKDSEEDGADHETVEDRMSRLLKWRIERDRLKKIAKSRAKPVFKIGIVHHHTYSPHKYDSAIHKCEHGKQYKQLQAELIQRRQRITRATEKRLKIKQLEKTDNTTSVNINIPVTNCAIETKQSMKESINNKENKKSFAPSNYKFAPAIEIQNSPLFGRIRIKKLYDEFVSPLRSDLIKLQGCAESNEATEELQICSAVLCDKVRKVSPNMNNVVSEGQSHKSQTMNKESSTLNTQKGKFFSISAKKSVKTSLEEEIISSSNSRESCRKIKHEGHSNTKTLRSRTIVTNEVGSCAEGCSRKKLTKNSRPLRM